MRPSAPTVLACLSALSLLGTPPAQADVLEVWGTHPGNLQAIIDQSSPGDVVLVHAGTYSPIVVPHALTVIGLATDVRIDWFTGFGSATPLVQLEGPGHGTVRLVGITATRMTGWSTWPAPALTGDGFDRLELLECVLSTHNSALTGWAPGAPGVQTTIPEVYLAGCSLEGSSDDADHLACCDTPGRPAIDGLSIVARNTSLTAGASGSSIVYSGTVEHPEWGPACAGFEPLIDGQAGGAAVRAQRFAGIENSLNGGQGPDYYCCDGAFGGDPYWPCVDGTFFLLGQGQQGAAFAPGVELLDVPANLDGPARTELGAPYMLQPDGGTAGGVLLVATALSGPTDVVGFGPLMLADPLVFSAVPPGVSQFGFVVPWSLDLIGRAIAFQAWTADAGLGVPVLTVIQP